jgi:amidase
MNTTPLNQLTACQILELTRGGAARAEDVTRACLDRIAAREPAVCAWAHLDAEQALGQARALDAAGVRGPLHGVPIGIKDVFDTADMPTRMGSPLYENFQPAADASAVALLRAAGAVILGKTVTAEFAGVAPGPTANPHNAAHTPGGSSSGSAAAVADMMAPIALGTQTGGSVQRPASFCGVVGFKPSYGRINRAGLKPAAESLDTIGWLARSVDDIALLDDVLSGAAPAPLVRARPAKIGLCRTPLWDTTQAETRAAVEQAAARLADAGIAVQACDLPPEFDRLLPVHRLVNDYERARGMAHEWRIARDRISPQLSASIERGQRIAHADYLDALRAAETLRRRFDAIAAGHAALLAPCVPGVAPEGLASTGNSALQSIWTLLHVPTLGLPTHRGPHNLPVSIQLVGARHADAALLRAGAWIHAVLTGA